MQWFLEIIHKHVSFLEQFLLFPFYQTNTHQLYHCATFFWRALTRTLRSEADWRERGSKGRGSKMFIQKIGESSPMSREPSKVNIRADTLVLSPSLLCCHQQEKQKLSSVISTDDFYSSSEHEPGWTVVGWHSSGKKKNFLHETTQNKVCG